MSEEFKLGTSEVHQAESWIKSHKETCTYLKAHSHETYKGIPTIGGQYYYKFTPTGLGNCIEVGCNFCGETKNVTDTSCW